MLALTVPLALSLRDRARSEQETQALTSALTIAAILNRDSLKEGPVLDRLVKRFAAQIEDGRVIVTDSKGVVLADSDGTAKGENFSTPLRPEMQEALGQGGLTPKPNADIRPSQDVGADILVAAAPVLDPGLIGAASERNRIAMSWHPGTLSGGHR